MSAQQDRVDHVRMILSTAASVASAIALVMYTVANVGDMINHRFLTVIILLLSISAIAGLYAIRHFRQQHIQNALAGNPLVLEITHQFGLSAPTCSLSQLFSIIDRYTKQQVRVSTELTTSATRLAKQNRELLRQTNRLQALLDNYETHGYGTVKELHATTSRTTSMTPAGGSGDPTDQREDAIAQSARHESRCPPAAKNESGADLDLLDPQFFLLDSDSVNDCIASVRALIKEIAICLEAGQYRQLYITAHMLELSSAHLGATGLSGCARQLKVNSKVDINADSHQILRDAFNQVLVTSDHLFKAIDTRKPDEQMRHANAA